MTKKTVKLTKWRPRYTASPKSAFRQSPYPPGWQKLRIAILARDLYACRICGRDASETVLHVHHVDGSKANSDTSNLVTLCSRCHHKLHLEDYLPGDWPDTEPPWGLLV